MRIKHCIILPLFSIVLMLGMACCSSDGCLDNGSSIPKADFYTNGTQVTVDSTTVRGIGAPGDSCIIKNESVKSIYLPLRATSTSCQFEIDFSESTIKDTISFVYTSTPVFVSSDCGAMYNFEIKSCTSTHNVIDSVQVMRTTVTNVDQTTLKIHLR